MLLVEDDMAVVLFSHPLALGQLPSRRPWETFVCSIGLRLGRLFLLGVEGRSIIEGAYNSVLELSWLFLSRVRSTLAYLKTQ